MAANRRGEAHLKRQKSDSALQKEWVQKGHVFSEAQLRELVVRFTNDGDKVKGKGANQKLNKKMKDMLALSLQLLKQKKLHKFKQLLKLFEGQYNVNIPFVDTYGTKACNIYTV